MSLATEEEIQGLYEIGKKEEAERLEVYLRGSSELLIMIRVAKRLKELGFVVESKSCSIPRYSLNENGYDSVWHDICERSHTGGFDLCVLGDNWERIGVEVKNILTMSAFHTALGQCICRLVLGAADRAIIYADRFTNIATEKKIRLILTKLNIQTISVQTLQ
jgi:hypothetical protein